MKKCYGITEGRTDGRTDRMTDRCKPVYPPFFQSRGINIIKIEASYLQGYSVFLVSVF